MGFKAFDVVRVTAINTDKLLVSDAFNTRAPKVGDIATILEVYGDPYGFELECCDIAGNTEWLIGVQEKDVRIELVNI